MSQKLRKAVDSLLKQTSKQGLGKKAASNPSPNTTSGSVKKSAKKIAPNRVTFRKNERAAKRQKVQRAAKEQQAHELRNGVAVDKDHTAEERIRTNLKYFLGAKTSDKGKAVLEKLKGAAK